jgi:HD-GYP domain-containing protein (c-di-GMP phosphodiesterase class II)
MRYTPLAVVKHRIHAGTALPFNVYDNDRTLLLARGRMIDDVDQLASLCARGTLVDLAELYRSADAVRRAPAALLPALWSDGLDRVGQVLREAGSASFRAALDEAAEPVSALIERDPDLAIFQVLRANGDPATRYATEHAVHTAIVARLVAVRLGWDDATMTSAFKAALTMNVSVLDLQGRMAAQPDPPTPAQRAELLAHPIESRRLLELSGVTDRDWLDAVERHHEEPDGSGYPHGLKGAEAVGELASLLRRADIYCAKLSGRTYREAIAADRAGREIFMGDPSNPINAALVKEFGVYPPGCFVALASGETGIVVKRGPTVMAPVVAAMTDRYGDPHRDPVRRDTAQPAHAIVGVLPAKALRVRTTTDKLAALVVA